MLRGSKLISVSIVHEVDSLASELGLCNGGVWWKSATCNSGGAYSRFAQIIRMQCADYGTCCGVALIEDEDEGLFGALWWLCQNHLGSLTLPLSLRSYQCLSPARLFV